MDQDHEAEAKRREQSVRTRDAAKPDEACKKARKNIDPERLTRRSDISKTIPNVFDRLPHGSRLIALKDLTVGSCFLCDRTANTPRAVAPQP
jgi:hypothetical protein